jgi:uncharacterized delta-60 repeat protein
MVTRRSHIMSVIILQPGKLLGITRRAARVILGLAIVTTLISAGLLSRGRVVADEVAAAAAGDLDNTFGIKGKVTTDFSVDTEVNAISIQGDGKILVAGSANMPAGWDFGLARYSADGGLDTSFGDAGSTTTEFFGGADFACAVAIQSDGKIVAAGTANSGATGFDFALTRYNTNGSLDTSFGTGGKVNTDFFGRDDIAFSLFVQSDGRIVAFGFATTAAGKKDMAVVRYNSDGSFNGNHAWDFDVDTTAFAMVQQPDGEFVIAGRATFQTGNSFMLVRLNGNDGSFDQSFGDHGVVNTNFGGNASAFAMALQPDGKILAAGYGGGGSAAPDFALACYDSKGSLDKGFGSGGKVTTDFFGALDMANAMVIQPDGKIVAVGYASAGPAALAAAPPPGSDFALARYNGDGSLDSAFGNGGKLTTDFFGSNDQAMAAVIQPDGKIVVAGTAAHNPGGPRVIALARYLTGAGPQQDFSLGFDQSSVTADRGTKARVTVRINRVGGFAGNVTVTPPDPAEGIKPKPADPISTTDSSVTFKMKVGGGAAVGPHQLTFTAKDDTGRLRIGVVTLVVQ